MSWETQYQDSLMYLMSKALDADSRGHSWKRDDMVYPDGYVGVDVFALSEGNHNGPECEACGYSFCQHCGPIAIDCPRPVKDLVEKMSDVKIAKRKR